MAKHPRSTRSRPKQSLPSGSSDAISSKPKPAMRSHWSASNARRASRLSLRRERDGRAAGALLLRRLPAVLHEPERLYLAGSGWWGCGAWRGGRFKGPAPEMRVAFWRFAGFRAAGGACRKLSESVKDVKIGARGRALQIGVREPRLFLWRVRADAPGKGPAPGFGVSGTFARRLVPIA